MAKIKNKKNKIKAPVKHSREFKPTHLKFNFSFLSYDDDNSEKYKADLFDRIVKLSSEPYIIVSNYNKKLGFEVIDKKALKIKKNVDVIFEDENSHRRHGNKYFIFRIYPNNNPIVARIIGEVIQNVFYIFFIDIGGTLYKH